ncbi:hypothetical protein H1Z61_17085 [Bacillus aquiflavi]|uniref:DUF600 domain-containing protein n=1 Tax=Bacillus aquiflavi TaxID=2672567 RepID=A0A6B3W6W3_9BACI|nr:hypothetical protein [Bacillus aquiflavi]MBA4538794.1 hypothetical protein [Bacillus aquiflavi]NEY83144.1 hypothetical protein [Bacillus aquiflavi]UAC49333.1 DUF600 domain-containing protein [Bacillus aquiflavi]
MSKIFEDDFMDIQADMVSLCLEYVDSKAENIYIYASNENGVFSFNAFYKINGKIVRTNEVNNVLAETNEKIDDNKERRLSVLKIGVQDLQRIVDLCKQYNQSIPTELKLKYDVKSNNLEADYKYENVYSDDNSLTSFDNFNAWYEEVKASNV